MARYTRDSRERVRDATDFEALVSARTELRRAGPRQLSGRCPFHEERTPSFGIDPVEKVYKCFGCGVGGDLFRFVMETESLTFPEALEFLAERAGIELEREAEDPDERMKRERRERLLALLDRGATFYAHHLWSTDEAADARAHLLSRGLHEEVLRRYRVGYAPSRWDRLLLASRKAGYSEEELHAVDLIVRGDRGTYDRFRERIMFPLADARGKVLGFGARRMRDDQHPAKYLNTRESELFTKSRMVYGADVARAEAAKRGSVVLAEGYTDVIALHQAGIVNSVAVMGTSLTDQQVRELQRLAPIVYLCLDADSAGQEAMLRAARVAAGAKLELLVVPMPVGQDPAEVLASEGVNGLNARLERAAPFARFHVERLLARGDLTSTRGRDQALAAVRPVIAETSSTPVLRDELVRLVADRIGLSQNVVNEIVAGHADAGAGGPAGAGTPGGGRPGTAQGGYGGQSADGGAAGSAGGQGWQGDGGAQGGGQGGWRGGQGGQGGRGGQGFKRGGGRPVRSGRWSDDDRGPLAGSQAPGAIPLQGALARQEQTERSFLTFCLALPDHGQRRLAALDLSDAFVAPLTRRAAAYLRDHIHRPVADLPDEDDELASLMSELVIRASDGADLDALHIEELQLDLLRLERKIATARAAGGEGLADLASERQRQREEFRRATLRAGEHARHNSP